MGGGLLQIAAYGAQDVYLTGDPQITFFKVVYRRHTNFSMEAIAQQFSGTVNFGKNDISCTISRNGDLVNSMFLQVTLPQLPIGAKWIDYVGHRLIKSVRVNLGGDTIDEHNGRWLHVWDQLTHTRHDKDSYEEMVGHSDAGIAGWTDTAIDGQQTLYIPLQFWFNRNPGLSLPLIALQYHEVKVVFNFENVEKLIQWPNTGTNLIRGETASAAANLGKWESSANSANNGGTYTYTEAALDDAKAFGTKLTSGFKANLYVDYIYLDTEERKRFAQMSHEYLIDQLQIQGKDTITSFNHRMRLNFNHPVKELIWVLEAPESTEETPGTGTLNTANFALFDGVRVNLDSAKVEWLGANSGGTLTASPGGTAGVLATTETSDTLSQFQITAGTHYKKGDVLAINTANLTGSNSSAEIVLKARHIARNSCYNGYVKKAGSSSVGVVTDFGIFGEGDKDEKYDWMKDAKLQINGHDRFSARPASYFRRVQPYQFHSGAPEVPVYCYSFALRPEEFQPSGTCNFSRIDNAYLDINLNEYLTPHIYGSGGASAQVPYYSINMGYSAGGVYTKPTFDAANCEVHMFAFAVSYNVLKIVSGRGGLAYSN